MEAIILAGGYGTRLKEVVADVPKPMAPVAGKPFLELLLVTLVRKGFTRIILSVGYMADEIITYFGNTFSGIEISYEIETEPLGTGGAISQALLQSRDDVVFIFNGDTYIDLEVDAVLQQWNSRKNPIIVVREVEDVSRYGCLTIADGFVTGIREKGETGSGLINAGCYLFPKDIFSANYAGRPFSLETEFFAEQLPRQPFDFFVYRGPFIDIGIPVDYQRAQSYLKHVF